MPTLFGKMAGFMTSMMPGRESQTEAAVAGNQHPAVDDDDDLVPLPSIVRDYRAYLVRAIYAGEETEEIIQKLIELECPKLEDKYYAVRARDLINLNNKSFQDLKNIHSGLGYIVKYAKYLFKDPDKRKDQWRMIPFKNMHYQKKIKPLQGSETLLMQLGYTEQTEQGLRFPQGQEPEKEKVVNLIADMMLFKKELKEYILDKHPYPQHIEQLLPQQTRDEVLAFRLSGLKIDDENVDAASGQSSIAYYNSPTSSTPTPQNHVQTHSSSSLNLECNNNNTNAVEPKLTEETEATKKTEQVPTLEFPLLAEGQAGTPAAAEAQGNHGDMQAIQDLVSSQEEVTDAVPSRSEGGSSSSSKRYSCSVCGEDAVLFCTGCSNKMLCENCNVNWHKHPARSQHPQMHRAESVSALISITPDSSLQLVFDATYGIHQTNNTKLSKKQQTYVMDQKSRIKKPERDQLYGNVPDLASLGQDILPGDSYSVNRTLYRNQQPNDYQILDYQRQQIHPSLYPMPNVLSAKNMSPYMNYPDENVIGHGLSQGDPHQQLHRPKQPLPQHLLESPEGLPSYVVQQLRDQQKRNLIGPFPSQQHPVPMPGSSVYVHNQTYPQAQPMSELGLTASYTNGPGSMYPPQLPSASLQKHSSNMYYGVAHSPYRPSTPLHGGHDLNMYGQFGNPTLHVHHGSAGYGPQMTRPYPGNNPGIMTSVASSGYYTDYQDNKLIPSSKYIQRLLQEPDIHKRKVKCENYIDDYEMDLKDLEKEFNDRLLEIDEFSESEVCRDMNKRKAALLKEKRNLEMFRNNMDTEPQKAPPAANLSHYKQDDQQIYYPPEIEKASLRPSRLQTPPSNYGQTAVQKAATTEGFQQGDPGVYNRSANNTGNLKAAAAAGTVREEGRKAGNSQHYKNAKSSMNQGVSRIPVESSSSVDDNFDIIHLPPPDIPPRPRLGSEENILNKIIQPPRQPGMFHPKQWQCQHCTYINEPTAHACSICDKTSINPELISDQFDEDHIGEMDNDHDQNEANISHEMSLKNDALLQMMTAGEGPDESFLSIDPDETPVVGANINGSQNQVMLEKKRAQEEYQQRMDRQVTASPQLLTASRSESQSPTPSSKTIYGVGARPKQTNSPRPDLTAGEVSLSGASDYHTPPSGLSPPPSTPPKGHPTSVSKLKESVSDKGGRMSSLEDALARYNEQTLIETLQAEGAQLSKLIKKADQEGFEVEAVQVALTFCEHQKMGPLEWLRSNWNKNVEKVIAMATAIGNKQQCNSVGELTASEAQSAYISCHANMKEAAQLCADRRIKLFEYLSQLGDFPREEILQTMNQCQGKQEESEYQLLRSNLQHFMDHIWAQKDSGQSSRFAFPDITSSDVCHSLSTSVIAHSDFQKMIKNKLIPTDRRIRLILVEGCLKSWGRAELVIKILDNDLPDEDIALEDVVEAVRNCQDRLSAIAYLQQECAVCFTKFPMSKIRSLNFCQCKMCEQCLAMNFEVVIREKHVRHWTCPLCSLPDLNDTEVASDYLQFLTLMLQPLVSLELQNLFEIKVRDWHLQKDPNFRWCAHCAEGFLAENRGHQLRLTCPHCGEKTCFSCKKEWEEQHEGLTCEQYAQWKIDNDPNNQSVGLAKHLDENGIDCPMCKMRFALAKGGCMHFKCPNCGHEFCSGCNEPYHHKEVCNKYKTCKNLGLHCHCPRDCFSYMRDYSVPQLQTLLKHHKVPFNVKTPDDQPDALHCPVMEQKEFDLVKKDEKCGKESVDGQAGLCELHYKEYLVDIINRHKLDPLSLMTRDAMIVLIRRYDLAVPHQKVGDTPEAYLACLTKVIKEKLPLRRS